MATVPRGTTEVTRRPGRTTGALPLVVPCAMALCAAAAILLDAGRGLTFYSDEWTFLSLRRDWDVDAFLQPHNEHLVAFPVLIYKVLFETVGMEPYWPYRVVVLAAHFTAVTLLFTIARRRHGPVVAGAVVLPLLVFGAAWEVTLWSFSIFFAGSVAAGLGAVLCLDRGDLRGDVAATALLIVALACSSLGVSFALGVLVEMVLRRGRRHRLWVGAVPLLAYGAWYLAYREERHTGGRLEWADAPWFGFRAAVAHLGGYLGFGNPLFGPFGGEAARAVLAVLLVGLLVAGIWLVVRRGRGTPRVAMAAVTLISFWALLSVSRAYSASPYLSKYIYPGAFLIVLLAVVIAPAGVPSIRVQGGLVAGAAVATVLGLLWLADGSWWLRGNVQALRAELGALEIARDHVAAGLLVDHPRAGGLRAADYFDVIDRFGVSPATTPDELEAEVRPARLLADATLLRAYGDAIRPLDYAGRARALIDAARGRPARPVVDTDTTAPLQARGSCWALRPASGAAPLDVTIPPGPRGLVIRPTPGHPAALWLRRFGTGRPAVGPTWTVVGPIFVSPPNDRSTYPWHARMTATRQVLVC